MDATVVLGGLQPDSSSEGGRRATQGQQNLAPTETRVVQGRRHIQERVRGFKPSEGKKRLEGEFRWIVQVVLFLGFPFRFQQPRLST